MSQCAVWDAAYLAEVNLLRPVNRRGSSSDAPAWRMCSVPATLGIIKSTTTTFFSEFSSHTFEDFVLEAAIALLLTLQ